MHSHTSIREYVAEFVAAAEQAFQEQYVYIKGIDQETSRSLAHPVQNATVDETVRPLYVRIGFGSLDPRTDALSTIDSQVFRFAAEHGVGVQQTAGTSSFVEYTFHLN